MSISPAPDPSAGIDVSIPRQRAASPSIRDVTSGRISEVQRLAGIAGPAEAIGGLEAFDGSLTVKASFADSIFKENPVIVGSPIPDLIIDGIRLDGLSAERIKRETELHVACWFGTSEDFFAARITEVDRLPVVEVLDRADRVLISSANLSLVPSTEAAAG